MRTMVNPGCVSWRRSANSMPFMPGIITSKRARSIVALRARRRASVPEPAARTASPPNVNILGTWPAPSDRHRPPESSLIAIGKPHINYRPPSGKRQWGIVPTRSPGFPDFASGSHGADLNMAPDVPEVRDEPGGHGGQCGVSKTLENFVVPLVFRQCGSLANVRLRAARAIGAGPKGISRAIACGGTSFPPP